MAFQYDARRFDEDQFAFYFSGGTGVNADELGQFLRRAAIIARRKGAELQVDALEPGSLAVIVRAVGKSRVARAVGNEFSSSPIQTMGAGAALVAVVVSALVSSMSPETGEAKSLGNVGAEIVEEGHVERIEIITREKTILVMDPSRAFHIRESAKRKKLSRLLRASEVLDLVEAGRSGILTGRVVDVEGEMYFRPEGYKYLVPIDAWSSEAIQELFPGKQFRVSADLTTRNGQPDKIIVYKATRI